MIRTLLQQNCTVTPKNRVGCTTAGNPCHSLETLQNVCQSRRPLYTALTQMTHSPSALLAALTEIHDDQLPELLVDESLQELTVFQSFPATMRDVVRFESTLMCDSNQCW